MIEIPLIAGASNAHQTFSKLLGGRILYFTLNYITNEGPAWSLDVYDGELLIGGIMLEPGEVARHDVGIFTFTGDEVTLDNLGSANHLMWKHNDE